MAADRDNQPVSVRIAGAADVDAVADLMWAQNRYHAELVPHIIKRVDAPGTKAWCAAQLADAEHTIFLAESADGTAAGLLMGHVKVFAETPVNRHVTLYFVDELYVHEDRRRQGAARALVAAARDFAATKGCSALSLNVWGANRLAIGAYEALGFDTVYQRMTLPVT